MLRLGVFSREFLATEGFEISEKELEKQILKVCSPLLDTHIITRRCQGAESFPFGGQEEATES